MHLSGRAVTISRTRIECGSGALNGLSKLIKSPVYRKSRVFILVDPGTGLHCLPLLAEACPELDSASVFEIEGGEASKSLATAEKIWSEMLAANADRHSLLINLGGGVVSDLGGFIAASIKRGIGYINIPTSLMAMADAAIGGKTGVNFQGLKNQIGFFHSPLAVLIDPRFLKTLPGAHIRSGFAEIVKSALVGDPVLWRKILRKGAKEILALDASEAFWQDMIMKTVSFKNRIVNQDFKEQRLRKILNFGHTAGHALESFSFGSGRENLLHGDAVALGMIAECRLSEMKTGLNKTESAEIISFLRSCYGTQTGIFKSTDKNVLISSIPDLLLHDKKNSLGEIRFTLLSAAGKPRINITAGQEEIMEALNALFE